MARSAAASRIAKTTPVSANARSKRPRGVGRTSTQPRASRKRGNGLADAPGIMVSLNAEHRHIASLLDALGRQSDGLLPGREADLSMVRDIVGYLNDFPDAYHHPREDLLFGILGQRDATAHEVIGRLREGHLEIYRRSRELLDLLDGGSLADDAGRRRLKYLCDRYIGFYRDHIDLEEGSLFPRATEKLRRDDWAAVNAGSRQVDDPLFGERVRKEYRRLSMYLSARVEKVGEDIAMAEIFGLEALVEGAVATVAAAAEIRGIVEQRLRSAVGDCAGILGSREHRAGLATPLAVAGSVRNHADAGAREIAAVLLRARSEFGESVAIRLRYLRKLLA
jgi:hemerythrin-like domain-containing protein